ncbi:hypothetical protein G6F64_014051 [Rhizopus arrhizus]|uniref:Acyl-CoA oxidase/dehydrogenase middle domain-containing protein n=1 Tax=Rhizopus oryzae TaxID=64495 RepID=A0A9P6WU64_RHIOR|nr:hypothetical protein G6F64_014051 [Rhizopus arrhizus]
MTEPAPGAGSAPSLLRARAERRGQRWVLNGHKQFISGGVGADFALVLAQTDAGATLFVVPANTPGYRVVRDIGMVTGYQIGGHAELDLDGCEVGDDAVLGEPGRGLEYAQLRLEPARLVNPSARAWPTCSRSRPWWRIRTSTCTPAGCWKRRGSTPS